MTQPLALGGQLGLLAGIRGDGLDLVQLVAVKVEVTLPGAVALLKLVELASQGGRLPVSVAVLRRQLEHSLSREAVQDLELGRGEGELAVLVLSVEGEQAAAEGP